MRGVPGPLHFAALESPIHAFRVLCGAWREASNWTSDAGLVTCPECAAKLAERAAVNAGEPASTPPRPPARAR